MLDRALVLLDRDLGVCGFIELWDADGTRFVRGELCPASAAHCTWIGTRYTIGAIRLPAPPPDPADVELLAQQLAPLAEQLIDLHASQHRSIREDIARLYERRIRDALVRSDWNASAVARQLRVGRGRIGDVARRWRPR